MKIRQDLKLNDTQVSEAEYVSFLKEIKGKIRQARLEAFRSINRTAIRVYWEIGRGIVERQNRLGWGKSIVSRLSDDLRRSFPEAEGFSTTNLWYMRQFFLTYQNSPNLQQSVGEIPWGQNVVIMSKVKTEIKQKFYLEQAARLGWTRDVLLNQIESKAFERFGHRQHNFPQALPKHLAEQADQALKDSYVLDFIFTEPMLERDLHQRLLTHIRDFLIELGIGFSFLGSQYRLGLGEKEYFIDLLFYHLHLSCLVAVELKIGDFKPEFAGKMDFCLQLLDEQKRLPKQNPSIGIILCKSKDRLEVEYALRGKKPMGVARYTFSRKLPRNLAKELPSPEQIQEGFNA
jgi:predicted nuclease of restriction endonuclease-like (RecB) superfamily